MDILKQCIFSAVVVGSYYSLLANIQVDAAYVKIFTNP